MRLIAALGGNALLRRGEPFRLATQQANAARAALALAPLAEAHALVLTHGNGPQVGHLALQAAALAPSDEAPLDLLDAESEGLIGYLLMAELQRRLPGREIVTLLTRVAVDPADPAFARPSKPIGPRYPADRLTALRRRTDWHFAPEGAGYRRVVASPAPRRILELAAIARLVEANALVICAGGGGIPVAETADGGHRGVEAVIDKDATSALLAESLGADALLLLTDVDAVRERWPDQDARRIRRAGPEALAGFAFAAGSMGPKVAAACDFARRTGRPAMIGALDDAAALLAGRSGTRIERDAGLQCDDG